MRKANPSKQGIACALIAFTAAGSPGTALSQTLPPDEMTPGGSQDATGLGQSAMGNFHSGGWGGSFGGGGWADRGRWGGSGSAALPEACSEASTAADPGVNARQVSQLGLSESFSEKRYGFCVEWSVSH